MLTLSLLFAGDYTSLQTAVVLSALPFSLVLVLFVLAMYRALHHENSATAAARWQSPRRC